MRVKTKYLYEFGEFRIDVGNRLLLRDREVIPLTPKAFDLLLVLVESASHVLNKEELMKQVWPDSFVEEANLSHHVFTLRKALGEDKTGTKFIETIPRRGYRFVASVTEIGGEADELVITEHSQTRIVIEQNAEATVPTDGIDQTLRAIAPSGSGKRRAFLFVLVCAAAIALAAVIYLSIKRNPGEQPSRGVKSIAVLPFKPLTSDNRDDYLELGMADTLITRLSSLKQIIVRPMSAVRKYTDLQQDALEAGRELQVEVVLDGSLQRLGDRLRMNARLINVNDGAILWADKFDEKFTDIFDVQDSMSQKLAKALALKLNEEGQKLLTRRYTANLEAYQLYVRGRAYWSTFRQADLQTSINLFNTALDKDPTYALAYCGLANAYSVMGIYGPLPPKEAYPKSREAALEALRLDDNLAEAHAALGAVKIFYDWDWAGAEVELKRALELDPNSVDAHSLYGYSLQSRGLADEAVIEERRAHDIDPVWSIANNDVAVALYLARRYDEAIKYAQDAIKLNPNSPRMLNVIGHSYLEKGLPQDATLAFQQALNVQPGYARAKAGLGYTYARLGKRKEALEIINQIKADQRDSTEKPHFIAAIYAALGEPKQALSWLDQAYEDHNPRMWQFKLDPRFDSLRSDERFQAFLRRLNLSQ
jgi:DNA-binding winged helix-turn-helix (wHTH) protein/TolB-like protein/Tfp pilus assembly protein PilF